MTRKEILADIFHVKTLGNLKLYSEDSILEAMRRFGELAFTAGFKFGSFFSCEYNRCIDDYNNWLIEQEKEEQK